MKPSLPALALACLMLLPACTASSRVDAIRGKAEQGDVHAQALMGEMYANGSDVKRDYGQAASWWSKAAAGGSAQAEYNLGVLYERGQGVQRSDAAAVRWYARAADQGLAAAEYNMGVFYEMGRGGEPRDLRQATVWYLKAAEKGYPDAQFNLGAIYARNQQPADAYFWLSIVARAGDRQAEVMRQDVGSHLPPAQTAEIMRKVDNWRPVAG